MSIIFQHCLFSSDWRSRSRIVLLERYFGVPSNILYHDWPLNPRATCIQAYMLDCELGFDPVQLRSFMFLLQRCRQTVRLR